MPREHPEDCPAFLPPMPKSVCLVISMPKHNNLVLSFSYLRYKLIYRLNDGIPYHIKVSYSFCYDLGALPKSLIDLEFLTF
jgi:hypothetical protein